MVFNKTSITDIDQTKTTKYGLAGKERLPDANEIKNIFDPLNGEAILKIQEVAELFNEVIKAEQSTAFDQTIYDRLARDKIDKKEAYEAINKNNGQYDVVVGTLFARKQQTPPPGTPTDEAGIKAKIGQLQASIANLQDEINKKVKERDAIINNSSLAMDEVEKAKEKKEKAMEIKLRLTDLTSTAGVAAGGAIPLVGSLPTGVTLVNNNNNNGWLEAIVAITESPQRASINPTWKIESVPGFLTEGREWTSKLAAIDVNYQLMDYLRKFGKNEVETAINNSGISGTVTVGSSTVSKKDRAVQLWNELINTKWYTQKFTDISRPANLNLVLHTDSHKADSNGKPVPRFKVGKLKDLKNDEWPNSFFDSEKFIEFMEIVFPRSTSDFSSSTNSLLTSLKPKDNPSEVTDISVQLWTKDPAVLITGSKRGNYPKLISDSSWTVEEKQRNLPAFVFKALNLKNSVNLFWCVYSSAKFGTTDTIDKVAWRQYLSANEFQNFFSLYVINWIKGIRSAGYGEDIITDEILLGIARENLLYSPYFTIHGKSSTNNKITSYGTDYSKQKSTTFGSRQVGGAFGTIILTGEKYDSGSLSTNLKTAEPFTNYQRYLYIKPLDKYINELKGEERRKQSLVNTQESAAAIREGDIANLQIQLQEAKDQESSLQRILDGFKGKNIEALKTEFRAKYKKQPYLYTLTEITELKSFLGAIEEKERLAGNSGLVDQDLLDAQKEIKEKIDEKLAKYTDFTEFHAIVKGNSEKLQGKSKTYLEKLKADGNAIKGIRKLETSESNLLADIDKAIVGGPTTPPSTTLDELKLQTVLHATGIGGSELHLSDWQSSAKAGIFNDEGKIKGLIGNYYEGSGNADEGAFKEHLKHADFGIEGTDYWKKFVKKGPEFIIGAIKHYEWENGKGDWAGKPKDATITNEMTDANDKEKAKNSYQLEVKEDWDTKKSAHIAQFLYRKAIGKSGRELIKKSEAIKTTPPQEKGGDNAEKDQKWFRANNWQVYAVFIGVPLAIAGICAIIWWDNIMVWWKGESDENVDTDTSSE